MDRSSSLARLQQATTLLQVGASLGWLLWHWEASPGVAVTGSIVILMGYSIFLAVEFVLLRIAGARDSVPQPTWGELARAWLRETLIAPVVFCWRQPFRWRAVPDQIEGEARSGRRGVVFVHGFVCNRGFWAPWMEELRARGHPYLAVNLEPVFGSIDDYVPIIDDAVTRVTQATGMPPVLVCHSMGGLAARAWLRAKSADERVHHVITIGSPHHGTWLARFSQMKNGRQMRQDSVWLRQLQRDAGARRHGNFTCWYSNCDNIAFPASTGTLPGADNRLVRGAAHVDLGFHPEVVEHSLALIASA